MRQLLVRLVALPAGDPCEEAALDAWIGRRWSTSGALRSASAGTLVGLHRLSMKGFSISDARPQPGPGARAKIGSSRVEGGELMPRILVTTEHVDRPKAAVMLDEHIATSDLSSDHFAARLIERIGWAVDDAESTEHQPVSHRWLTDS
jgi:hypothetical protein